MKKVAFVNDEYNASLPPYRFQAGDVVEIADEWADQLVQRGLAKPARANAKTVQQIRQEARPPVPTAADVRAQRRAELLAEIERLDREGGTYGDDMVTMDYQEPGHYGDMVTRGDLAPLPEEDAAADPKPKAKK